jgi:hypothetical protein
MKFKDIYGDLSGTTYEGYLDCANKDLTSLEGCPKIVNGNFYCDHNKLTSLKGCPEEVKGRFYCSNNNLTSLEGSPKKINKGFYCHNNNIASLDSLPRYYRFFYSEFSTKEYTQYFKSKFPQYFI